jgi:DNA-binding transcriptional MocR family regulator
VEVVVRARELLGHLEPFEVTDLTSAALATAIAALVRDGRLPAGVDLPSERDLAATIGRSRGTIARAYEQLRHEGLAHTRHGAGTTIGCCAGPWASSRAAELVPVLPLAGVPSPLDGGRVIDLRRVRWAPELHGTGQLTGSGPQVGPGASLLTAGRVRALDVVLTALARPGEAVLVPELTDPAVLALFHVRGLRGLGLPLDRRGRPDLPGWLRRIRSRPSPVVLLPATHAAPNGTTLASHERQLLAETAVTTDATLIEDRNDADLWIEHPPPPPMTSFDQGERTISIAPAATPAMSHDELASIHTTNATIATRVRAVSAALHAMPEGHARAATGGTFPTHPQLWEQRRRHLVEHTAALIRWVTPLAPQLSMVEAAGGAVRWVRTGNLPGSVVTDAARARGVLVEPAASWQVGDNTDPPAVTLTVTGPTDELLAGVQVLIEVVRDLA